MPDKVRCANCGFLAIRNKETRDLEEMDSQMRGGDTGPTRVSGMVPYGIYEHYPTCIRMVATMATSVAVAQLTADPEGTKRQAIIDEDRDCKSFKKWERGFSPKEHVEMDMLERAERRELWRDVARGIEFLAVLVLAIIGFMIQYQTAKLQADATLKASQPQPPSQPVRQPRLVPTPDVNVPEGSLPTY